ncbi:MAG: lytic transglycosylase domain-containing protein [Labrys sp. (in: a-proteobacteria)]
MILRAPLAALLFATVFPAAAGAGSLFPALGIDDATPSHVTLVNEPDVTGSLGEPAGVPSGEMATLRIAIAGYKSGSLSEGDAAAAGLSDPAARAIAEWVAIRSAPRDIGFKRIQAFVKRYPKWPAALTISRRAEEALYYDNASAAVVEAFFDGRKPLTDEGKIALAEVRLAAGDKKGATALVRDAYRNDPLTKPLEADILKRFGSMLSKADLKFRADRLIYGEDYEDGLRAAATAGKDVLALAKARIAVAKKAKNAKALLAAVPASLHGDPAYLFARIQFLRREEKAAESAKILARIPGDAGLVDGDAWWTERRLVARQLLDQGNAKTAYSIVAAHGAVSDQSQMDAEFHAGWIALRFLGDAKTGARHFAALTKLAERPISVARGNYWQGRAAEALGDKGSAVTFYKTAARHTTTYYGQLAKARLGGNEIVLRDTPAPSGATRLAFNRTEGARAIAMLYDLGERDLARILVGEYANRLDDPQTLALLGDLAASNKDAKAALSVGKSAMQRGLPLDMVAFPTGAIPKFETVDGVEKAVVYGIARQESEFSTEAVSHAGARGLMQLMPATAKATAKTLGMRFDAKKLTSDPAYNARIGAAHLGELIDDFNGSYVMTFAAYNAGSSRVAEWVEKYGDPRDPRVDPIDWVERIPFTETRNYVQRVMENVQVYRARLSGKTALLIERDLRRGVD